MLVDQLAQSEPLVQFPNENQATIRGDARSLEIDFEKSVEGELKRLVFFFTHWVLASVRPDRARSPINKDAEGRWKVGMPKSNWKCGTNGVRTRFSLFPVLTLASLVVQIVELQPVLDIKV